MNQENDYPYNYGSLAMAVQLFLDDCYTRDELARALREAEARLTQHDKEKVNGRAG